MSSGVKKTITKPKPKLPAVSGDKPPKPKKIDDITKAFKRLSATGENKA
jgi:hypothetical protein